VSDAGAATARVAINGFGRIGRNFLRAALDRGAAFEVVALNDITDRRTLAHLIKYDSLVGPYRGSIALTERGIEIDGHEVVVLAEGDPERLPWGELGVDVVLESTGRFTRREQAAAHLRAGARKVLISAPAGDADVTVVVGVNDEDYDPAAHEVVSNASCTTNCLAPVAKVLHQAVGIRHGLMTTVHAYTADQRLQDAPHSDLRRARAAAVNLVPTSTGAAKAVGLVLPELAGKLHGFAIRAPVISGSVVDLTFEAERETSVEELNCALREAALSERLSAVLEYTEEPIVSSDIVGNPHSSVLDGSLTSVIDERLAKVIAWYDNEWGYSNRCVDLLERMLKAAPSPANAAGAAV
jgi:glyceraldehyde 3-phosphate dehydrogenase